jgi:hypothetical protein
LSAGLQSTPHLLIERLVVTARLLQLRITPNHFLRREAGNPAECIVDGDDVAVLSVTMIASLVLENTAAASRRIRSVRCSSCVAASSL